jgi:hypothetical protein
LSRASVSDSLVADTSAVTRFNDSERPALGKKGRALDREDGEKVTTAERDVPVRRCFSRSFKFTRMSRAISAALKAGSSEP